MAPTAVTDGAESWSVRIPQPIYDRLMAHLFPGDRDEHGAVLIAGVCRTDRGVRLLVRDVVLAKDGIDYVPGQRGYRALTALFVATVSGRCADEGLAYLAVHNHGGRGSVGFSPDDWASHERGYPALLDITNGGPVGALVFAEDAVAGDIWLPGGERRTLTEAVIVGPWLRHLYPAPPPARPAVDRMYDRHARMFGDLGQQRLAELKVGVIGAGGVGSLVNQLLCRLGVGHVVIVDPERVDLTNLPRVVGATSWDARARLARSKFRLVRRLGERWATPKVAIARRVAWQAQPGMRYQAIFGDVRNADVAQRLADVDVLFLAADTMQCRAIFNALVHQYLIPGFQIGAKVRVDPTTQQVEEIFTVNRPVMPYAGGGCLWCNRLISPVRLQEEQLTERERRAQRYVEAVEVEQPSVITLNGITAAQAVNDMLLLVTGLFPDEADLSYRQYDAQERRLRVMRMRALGTCLDCSTSTRSRLGCGDRSRLPCRPAPPAPRRP